MPRLEDGEFPCDMRRRFGRGIAAMALKYEGCASELVCFLVCASMR